MTAADQSESDVLEWHALVPRYVVTKDQIQYGVRDLSPAWRLFLLGDGSPTRHLQLLTGLPTAVKVIEYSAVGEHIGHLAPKEMMLIPGPRARRQVWLETESGERLGYAASWWRADKMHQFLTNQSIPIGSTVASGKRELYRHILSVFLGDCKDLELEFGHSGPFWGRYYLFYHEGKPLTLIYEVFSPALRKYLD